MTEPKNERARLVDLSVVAMSALVLGGAMLVVADVDASRPTSAIVQATDLDAGSITGLRGAPSAPPSIPTSRPATVATAAPAGLVPAPRATRRVVVVRRSRPS